MTGTINDFLTYAKSNSFGDRIIDRVLEVSVQQKQNDVMEMLLQRRPDLYAKDIPATVLRGIGVESGHMKTFARQFVQNSNFENLVVNDGTGSVFINRNEDFSCSTPSCVSALAKLETEIMHRLNSDVTRSPSVQSLLTDGNGTVREVQSIRLNQVLGDIYAPSKPSIELDTIHDSASAKPVSVPPKHPTFTATSNIMYEWMSTKARWHNDDCLRFSSKYAPADADFPDYLNVLIPVDLFNVDIFVSSTMLVAPYQEKAWLKGRPVPLLQGDALIFDDRMIMHAKPFTKPLDPTKPSWRIFLRISISFKPISQ